MGTLDITSHLCAKFHFHHTILTFWLPSNLTILECIFFFLFQSNANSIWMGVKNIWSMKFKEGLLCVIQIDHIRSFHVGHAYFSYLCVRPFGNLRIYTEVDSLTKFVPLIQTKKKKRKKFMIMTRTKRCRLHGLMILYLSKLGPKLNFLL